MKSYITIGLLCFLTTVTVLLVVASELTAQDTLLLQQTDTTVVLLPVDTTATPVDTLLTTEEAGSDETAAETVNDEESGITGDQQNNSSNPEAEETRLLDDVQDVISFRKLFSAVLVLVLIYFVLRFLTSLVENLSERFTSNRLVLKRIIPILKITLWSLGLYFVIAGILDPPIETIITVSASVGIAVGFASQDILRNVFGGIMIILDKPFQVGDKIEIAGHYGEVIEIGLRSVRIVTGDDSVVSLPNGELMNKAVSNSNSSALDCQVVAEIFLPAGVDLVEVRELAYRAAATSRYVYLNKPIVVNAMNEIHHDHFIVKLRVKAYVLDIRYEFRFKSDMTELILSELSNRGILAAEIPEKL